MLLFFDFMGYIENKREDFIEFFPFTAEDPADKTAAAIFAECPRL